MANEKPIDLVTAPVYLGENIVGSGLVEEDGDATRITIRINANPHLVADLFKAKFANIHIVTTI